MIDVKCTCGETYHAGDEFIGQNIKCRKCGAILLIQKQVPSITNDPTVQFSNNKPEFHSPPALKFNYPIIPKKSRLNKEIIKRYLIWSLIAIIIIGFIFIVQSNPDDPYSDWDKVTLPTGKSPDLKFSPIYDYSIDNSLEISVGANTDVVLKLCNLQTGQCIRYVYIWIFR